MPHRAFNFQLAGGLSETADPRSLPARDILWGRPIFRAPHLSNPRVIFDPLPFRTQFTSAARRLSRLAGR